MRNNVIVYIILVQLWVAGEKAQPSSRHMREKTSILLISFRGHEDLSYCIKSGRMSGILASGKNFSINKYCLTALMTFKIPSIIWDVGDSFNLFVGVQRPEWLYVLGIRPRADMPLWPPEHVPRTSGRAQTWLRGPDGLHACYGADSTGKDPRLEEKRTPKGQKNTVIFMWRFPFGTRATWNPRGDASWWKWTRR